MSAPPPLRVHGTAVALDHLGPWSAAAGSFGVLLTGDPGRGKSSGALQLIEAGARLVADDQVLLALEGGRIIMRAPPAIAGLIEIRGVGIVAAPHMAEAVLTLVIACEAAPERLPGPVSTAPLPDAPAVRHVALDPSAAGFVAKVKATLAAVVMQP